MVINHHACRAFTPASLGCPTDGPGSCATPRIEPLSSQSSGWYTVNAHRSILAGVSSVALLVAACAGAAASPPPKALDETVSEYTVVSSSDRAAAGDVTFTIKNTGTVVHEFVVLKTDLTADKLPSASGEVEEDASELSPVDEVEDIAPGATATLSVALPAGHYVLICNLPGHYAGGMHANLDVTATS